MCMIVSSLKASEHEWCVAIRACVHAAATDASCFCHCLGHKHQCSLCVTVLSMLPACSLLTNQMPIPKRSGVKTPALVDWWLVVHLIPGLAGNQSTCANLEMAANHLQSSVMVYLEKIQPTSADRIALRYVDMLGSGASILSIAVNSYEALCYLTV